MTATRYIGYMRNDAPTRVINGALLGTQQGTTITGYAKTVAIIDI